MGAPRSEMLAFPEPTDRIVRVYHYLAILEGGDEAAGQLLLDEGDVPRPWDVTTIDEPELRWEVWKWLEAFVVWFNCQHAWYSNEQIPPCWPEHPGFVREIGTLADQRRVAGEATGSGPLEEWHRYAVPAFLERTRSARTGCENKHVDWPGRAAWRRHISDEAAQRRQTCIIQDCTNSEREQDASTTRLHAL